MKYHVTIRFDGIIEGICVYINKLRCNINKIMNINELKINIQTFGGGW